MSVAERDDLVRAEIAGTPVETDSRAIAGPTTHKRVGNQLRCADDGKSAYLESGNSIARWSEAVAAATSDDGIRHGPFRQRGAMRNANSACHTHRVTVEMMVDPGATRRLRADARERAINAECGAGLALVAAIFPRDGLA